MTQELISHGQNRLSMVFMKYGRHTYQSELGREKQGAAMALFAPSTVECLHDLWIENIDRKHRHVPLSAIPRIPNWENCL